MLQIENASIAYGNDILFSGFNLQLERGEIASISGPSGCGKSSLLNAILGFTPLKEGRIVLNAFCWIKETSTLSVSRLHGFHKNWHCRWNG